MSGGQLGHLGGYLGHLEGDLGAPRPRFRRVQEGFPQVLKSFFEVCTVCSKNLDCKNIDFTSTGALFFKVSASKNRAKINNSSIKKRGWTVFEPKIDFGGQECDFGSRQTNIGGHKYDFGGQSGAKSFPLVQLGRGRNAQGL